MSDAWKLQTCSCELSAKCLLEIKLFWEISRAFQISKRSKGLRSHKLSRTEVHLFPTVVYLLVFAKLGDETRRPKESCRPVPDNLLARRWITCSLKWPTVPGNCTLAKFGEIVADTVIWSDVQTNLRTDQQGSDALRGGLFHWFSRVPAELQITYVETQSRTRN